jgi:hypothetical protein
VIVVECSIFMVGRRVFFNAQSAERVRREKRERELLAGITNRREHRERREKQKHNHEGHEDHKEKKCLTADPPASPELAMAGRRTQTNADENYIMR